MATYRRILIFARPYMGKLILATLCLALGAALNSASMYLIKVVTDDGFLNKDVTRAGQLLPWLALGVVITMLLRGLFSYFGDILNNRASLSIVEDVRAQVFEKLMRLPLRYHQHQRLGQLITRVTNDAALMQTGVSDVVGRVIGSGLNILGLVGLILWLNWRLTGIILLVFPIALFPLYHFGRKIRHYSTNGQERMADLASLLHETLAGIRVVAAFNRETWETKRFRAAAAALTSALRKQLMVAALATPVMDTIGGVAVAGMIWIAGQEVLSGRMSFGDFLALVGSIGAIYPQIKSMNGVNKQLQDAVAAAERIFLILDEPLGIADAPGAKLAKPLRKALELRDLSFSYVPGNLVLRGIHLTLRAGERVALVGPSGGGKSTLADLVPRFHDPVAGAILWDGVDLRQLKLQSLREQIAVVTQDTFLFNESIAANIAYGRAGATSAQIKAAAKAANAHEFIVRQAEGYDTKVGERGVRLSGGQRQRLAIARALLKDPPLLILDEATSALDTQSERLVQQALDRLMKGRSTLVIAHRLSTIQHADQILVVDKGRVVERGTHTGLLKKRGLYAKLYRLQFSSKRKVAA